MSLIITTGDISDADGFICLADYAKNTNADILFIMNYPAYFLYYDKQHEKTDLYEGFNYGLKELLEKDWELQSTKKKILNKIDTLIKSENNKYIYNELIRLKINLKETKISEETINSHINGLTAEISYIKKVYEIETSIKSDIINNLNEIITELKKYKLKDKYMLILDKFGITDKDDPDNLKKFKLAYTKFACFLVDKIFNEAKSQSGGKKKIKGGTRNIFFKIGGINNKNPFSVDTIKNELFVYADFINENLKEIFDIEDEKLNNIPTYSSYENVYLDMCGSVAFYNDDKIINEFQTKIKGFFIMGGVLCDVEPFTLHVIKNTVHRPYFVTMNQYYHKENFIDLSNFLKELKIPFFVLPNNAILTDPNLIDFIKDFFQGNTTLLEICETYYNSFNGNKKPFDFMISRTIVNYINRNLTIPSSPQSFMYVEKKYGGTFLTKKEYLTFDELKSLKILTKFPDEKEFIDKMSGELIKFPCHILSLEQLTDIDSKKEISYIEHHTPYIFTYDIILSKYKSNIREKTGINGGFKPKIIKIIRKYKKMI